MIVEHFGSSKLQPILPVKNDQYRNKPLEGGLWTSPVDSKYSWREWCINEYFCTEKLETSFKLEISTDTLLKIASFEDFSKNLIEKGFVSKKFPTLSAIDFETLSQTYNGIWLTMKGQSETRFSHPHNLYGWDCETVFLFNEKPIIKEYR